MPSGREPVLHVGSPRGSLYHAKTEYALRGGRPHLPRFLGPETVDPLVARGGVDLRAEVWPLMAKEIAWGWYHELLHGHPDRVRLDADTFTARYAAADWGSPEMAALLDEAVPDPRDHLDFRALDRPLDGVGAGSLDDLQPLVRAHIDRGPAPARRPRAHPAPRGVRGDAVGVRAGHAAGHRGRADRPVEGPRHPVVAGLLQRGRQRPARVPGAPAPGAVARRVRAVPRAGDVDRGRRRPVPGGRVGRARGVRDGDRDGRRAAAGAQRVAHRGPAARRICCGAARSPRRSSSTTTAPCCATPARSGSARRTAH